MERGSEETTVWLKGELDLAGAPKVHRCIEELVESDVASVVVDLADLEFIDSTGIGVLVSGFKLLTERGGSFCLRSPTPRTTHVLGIVGIDKIISIV